MRSIGGEKLVIHHGTIGKKTSPGPKKQMQQHLRAYTYHWFPLNKALLNP